jgi:hypothetical protein
MCHTKEAGVQWSLLSLILCGIMRSRYVALLQTSHSPPPPKPLIPLYPSYYRFNPLAALQRDGPGWCTPSTFTSSQICDLRMATNVCKYCQIFSLQYKFLMEHSSNICPISIDYFYLFRLIIHSIRIKSSLCIHQIFLAVVANSISILSIQSFRGSYIDLRHTTFIQINYCFIIYCMYSVKSSVVLKKSHILIKCGLFP